MVEQKISLDFVKNGVQRTVHARQGENAARDILISLTANGEPVDVGDYTLKVIYPDGTHSVLEARNPVRVTIPQEMCLEVGENVCEIQIAEDSEEGAILYSPQFRVLVEGTILGASGSSEPIGDPTVYQPLIAGLEPYPSALGANAKIPVYDPAQNGTKLADPAVLQPDVTELEGRVDAIGDALGGVILQLPEKVDKVSGKGLSTNDYTDADKAKVGSLATVATSGSYNDLTDKPTIPEQLQSDWNQSDTTAKDFIKNKPNITAPVQPDWSEADSTALNFIKNKPSIPSIAGLEETANKVTSLSAQSTDTQYPSAKCIYDLIGGLDDLIGTGVIE